MVTVSWSVPVTPALALVAVSVTVYVPLTLYALDTVAPTPVLPSPNCHAYAVSEGRTTVLLAAAALNINTWLIAPVVGPLAFTASAPAMLTVCMAATLRFDPFTTTWTRKEPGVM